MTGRSFCAILLILSGLGQVRADDSSLTAVQKEKQTLESFARANTSCREWSDGCAVCVRHDDGTFACSLPGIACEPTVVTCRNVAQVPKTDDKPVPPPKEPEPTAPQPKGPDPKAPSTPATPAK